MRWASRCTSCAADGGRSPIAGHAADDRLGHALPVASDGRGIEAVPTVADEHGDALALDLDEDLDLRERRVRGAEAVLSRRTSARVTRC